MNTYIHVSDSSCEPSLSHEAKEYLHQLGVRDSGEVPAFDRAQTMSSGKQRVLLEDDPEAIFDLVALEKARFCQSHRGGGSSPSESLDSFVAVALGLANKSKPKTEKSAFKPFHKDRAKAKHKVQGIPSVVQMNSGTAEVIIIPEQTSSGSKGKHRGIQKSVKGSVHGDMAKEASHSLQPKTNTSRLPPGFSQSKNQTPVHKSKGSPRVPASRHLTGSHADVPDDDAELMLLDSTGRTVDSASSAERPARNWRLKLSSLDPFRKQTTNPAKPTSDGLLTSGDIGVLEVDLPDAVIDDFPSSPHPLSGNEKHNSENSHSTAQQGSTVTRCSKCQQHNSCADSRGKSCLSAPDNRPVSREIRHHDIRPVSRENRHHDSVARDGHVVGQANCDQSSPCPDLVPRVKSLPAADRHPLLTSVRDGDVTSLRGLLNSSYQINDVDNLRDSQGNTLLHLAAERGHVQCVSFLVDLSPALTQWQNKNKLTPAALAIKSGQTSVVDWMLRNVDLDRELRVGNNRRPLVHHAARFGQDDCLRLVLDKMKVGSQQCDLNDSSGNSPAHMAAKHGHLTCLQTLLEYGVDITRANKYGHTPCFYADFGNHLQSAGYIMVVETCVQLAHRCLQLTGKPFECSDDNAHPETPDDEPVSASRLAWHMIKERFQEASNRLVVCRTRGAGSHTSSKESKVELSRMALAPRSGDFSSHDADTQESNSLRRCSSVSSSQKIPSNRAQRASLKGERRLSELELDQDGIVNNGVLDGRNRGTRATLLESDDATKHPSDRRYRTRFDLTGQTFYSVDDTEGRYRTVPRSTSSRSKSDSQDSDSSLATWQSNSSLERIMREEAFQTWGPGQRLGLPGERTLQEDAAAPSVKSSEERVNGHTCKAKRRPRLTPEDDQVLHSRVAALIQRSNRQFESDENYIETITSTRDSSDEDERTSRGRRDKIDYDSDDVKRLESNQPRVIHVMPNEGFLREDSETKPEVCEPGHENYVPPRDTRPDVLTSDVQALAMLHAQSNQCPQSPKAPVKIFLSDSDFEETYSRPWQSEKQDSHHSAQVDDSTFAVVPSGETRTRDGGHNNIYSEVIPEVSEAEDLGLNCVDRMPERYRKEGEHEGTIGVQKYFNKCEMEENVTEL